MGLIRGGGKSKTAGKKKLKRHRTLQRKKVIKEIVANPGGNWKKAGGQGPFRTQNASRRLKEREGRATGPTKRKSS